jgi:hypothetical protein
MTDSLTDATSNCGVWAAETAHPHIARAIQYFMPELTAADVEAWRDEAWRDSLAG